MKYGCILPSVKQQIRDTISLVCVTIHSRNGRFLLVILQHRLCGSNFGIYRCCIFQEKKVCDLIDQSELSSRLLHFVIGKHGK